MVLLGKECWLCGYAISLKKETEMALGISGLRFSYVYNDATICM